MGLNTEERKQVVNTLYNYTERVYVHRQDYREYLDHLIEQYAKVGLDGLGQGTRAEFLELIEEAL